MPRFEYSARSSAGQSTQGVISANSLADATRQLRADGKFVVRLTEAAEALDEKHVAQISIGGRRVKTDEIIYFASQMSVMVDTGVALTEALESVIDQSGSPAFRRVMEQVLADVETGTPLSDALANHPRVFKPLFVNLVRASEASGRLGPILQRIADYMMAQRETRRKVVGAMIYPAFLLFMSINVTAFLLTFLMPRFIGLYKGKEDILPTPTKILIAISGWITGNWAILAGVGGGTILFLMLYARAKSGVRVYHWLLLNTPLIGRMMHKSVLTRSLRTLGTLIDADVPMLDAVDITRNVSGNVHFEDMWDEVSRRVEVGEQLSKPLFGHRIMPRSVAQMISAGERSGHLPLVLDRVSVFLERDLDQAIKRVTNMIEPIMIVIMGALVGSVAIALLLPVLTISRTMGR